MNKSRLPQDIATERFEVISPLLDPNLDKNLFCEKKKELATRYSISYRTISRWFQRYQQDGFKGLIPKSPVPEKTATPAQDNFNEIVDLAIELRRECPTRSVKTIIKILELEGHIAPGTVCRSTLQRHLQKRGYGTKQILRYQHATPAARRFQKSHRGALYQGDIKFGPYLPIGPKGKMQQTYLAAWIDDATRFIVGAKFYANQTTDIIEDSLRMAIMQWQAIPQQMAYACLLQAWHQAAPCQRIFSGIQREDRTVQPYSGFFPGRMRLAETQDAG